MYLNIKKELKTRGKPKIVSKQPKKIWGKKYRNEKYTH